MKKPKLILKDGDEGLVRVEVGSKPFDLSKYDWKIAVRGLLFHEIGVLMIYLGTLMETGSADPRMFLIPLAGFLVSLGNKITSDTRI